jgi:hypothetical protein
LCFNPSKTIVTLWKLWSQGIIFVCLLRIKHSIKIQF